MLPARGNSQQRKGLSPLRRRMMIEPSCGLVGFFKNPGVLRPPPPHRGAVDDRQPQNHDHADVDDPHQPSPDMPSADIEHGGSPFRKIRPSPEETKASGKGKSPSAAAKICPN